MARRTPSSRAARRRVLGALAALFVFAAAPGGAGASEAAGLADWTRACLHYENRARFKSRETAVEFVTVLAEGCAAALRSASEPALARAERAAAGAFLDRLAAARRVIGAINARRLAGAAVARARYGRFSRFSRDLASDLGLVSATGEYLILRAEGVYRALGDWVKAGAEFALIAALPGPRGSAVE